MEAARAGDINAFYEQIREESNYMDNIDKLAFALTPLHVAASEGRTEFAMEMITLKPSFARKLNCDGFSPLHLAVQNGKNETALRLLDTDAELVRVKGREGKTPLHVAVEKGNLHLVSRFLSVCPKSVLDVTNNRSETPLHIALRNSNMKAFKLLFSVLQCLHYDQEAQNSIKQVLNWKDNDGNTPLHLAIYADQVESVKCLVNSKVDVSVLGLFPITNSEIRKILGGAGARSVDSLSGVDTNHEHFLSLRADQRLNAVAQKGNVDAIYELLGEDAYLLERIDQVPFTDTPLHVAASAGNIAFALEVMRLKPSFARKLNQDGYSPMHLALEYGQTDLFKRLLDVDRSLVRVQGKEGKTSLHYVAEKGNPDLLSELLVACPESFIDVTTTKENALHVAVKNGRLENLEVLLRWLKYVGMEGIVRRTDAKGNTLLHIAMLSPSHKMEMVKLLIGRVPINARNSAGRRALEILLEDQVERPPELENLLGNAGTRDRPTQRIDQILNPLQKKSLSLFDNLIFPFFRRYRGSSTNENRSAILVVAVMIATATYQAAIRPSNLVEPEYQHSQENIFITGANATTGAVNATLGAASFNTTTPRGKWGNIFPVTWKPVPDISFFGQLFQALNMVAFQMSMMEIVLNVPWNTAIYIVYPLTVCFMLLMTFRSLAMLLSFIAYAILLTLIRCRTTVRAWSSGSLGIIFKHYGSFHKEMTSSD